MTIDFISSNLDACKKGFSKIIQSTGYVVSSSEVSWSNYLMGIEKSHYVFDYCKAVNNQQYSFLLTDGSFFQFYYRFGSDLQIEKARLAYYPKPSFLRLDSTGVENIIEQNDNILDGVDELYDFLDGGLSLDTNTHVRFDYDKSCKSHEPNHIQFSAFHNFRIPSQVLLNPFIFIDFIIGNLSDSDLVVESNSNYKNKKDFYSSASSIISIKNIGINIFNFNRSS